MGDRSDRGRPGGARRLEIEAEGPERLYGIHTCLAVLANRRRKIIKAYATRNVADRLAAEFADARVELEILLPAALDRLVGSEAVHQGVVIDAHPLDQPRLDQIDRSGLVVLLDQVTDPHNVGAVMRSCAAFGATALVMTARHSPAGSAVVTKAASGAAEQVPLVKVTNLSRAIAELQGYGFRVYGLDGEAETAVEQVDRTPPIAIVLGAEGKGLRKLTRETCDGLVRISTPGPLASLNVSNAAALALYVLTRPAG